MKTMGITKFKAYALRIVDQVAKSKESLVITKRGKPVAELIPFVKHDQEPVPGKLSDVLVFEENIVDPLGDEMWDVCK